MVAPKLCSSKSIPKIEQFGLHHLGKMSINSILQVTSLTSNNELNLFAIEKRFIELKYFLLKNVPFSLQDDIFKEITKSLNDLYILHRNSQQHWKVETIVFLFFELLSHLHIEKLSTSSTPLMTKFLCPHLHNMTKLKLLAIENGNQNLSPEMEHHIIQGLKNIPNLECFTLQLHCSDKIIRTIIENCKKLKYLNVEGSKGVTNTSVVYLSNWEYLEEVQLDDTNINVYGYLSLLKYRPTLTNVGCCASFDSLFRCISYDKTIQLNLKVLEVGKLSSISLVAVNRICPNLQMLHINVHNSSADLGHLNRLTGLQTFGALQTQFHNVEKLLQNSGQNLTNLKLLLVENVNLMKLCELCPKLEYLMISECSFINSQFSVDRRSYKKYFSNLKNLVCCELIPERELKFLLSNCENIKILNIDDLEGILTEENCLEILNANKFKELEELHLGINMALTRTSLELLIQNCSKLRKVSGLNFCKMFSEMDTGIFMRSHKQLQIESEDVPQFYLDVDKMLNFSTTNEDFMDNNNN